MMKFNIICTRCGGSGKFDRGTCFKCNGTGNNTVTRKPPGSKKYTFVVHYKNGSTNNIIFYAHNKSDALEVLKRGIRLKKLTNKVDRIENLKENNMKFRDFRYELNEARMAPIYHFTLIGRFAEIMKSGKLLGRKQMERHKGVIDKTETISVTRDITSDFSRHGFTNKLTIGFRLDQNKISQRYKIGPAQHNKAYTLKDLDKKTQDKIVAARKSGDYSSLLGHYHDGNSLEDIAKGKSGLKKRHESEERINVKELPLKNHLTGIVLNGKQRTPVEFFLENFKHRGGFELRNLILDSAIKWRVKIIYNRREYDPRSIKNDVIKYFMDRKKNAKN